MSTNGISLSEFPTPTKKQEKEEKIFAYVGTIGMAHNVDIILQAAKYFEDNNKIKFLLIGDGAEQHKIFNKAKKHPNVDTKSLLIGNKAIEEINKVDVGIVTLHDDILWRDALPTKIFEFLALEKPVILSIPYGSTSKMIKKNNCGETAGANNVENLIKSINNYLNNDELIKLHGHNGRKLIKNSFCREKNWLRTYKKH